MSGSAAIRRLFSYARPHIAALALALILTAGAVALTLYAPILIGRGVDLVAAPGGVGFDGLIPVLWALALAVAGASFFQWIASLLTGRVAYRVARDIRVEAFRALSRAPVKYVDTHRHGDILSRLIADVDQVSDALLLGFAQLFTSALTILGTIAFMLSINVWIALIVVVITPLSLFVARYIARHTYDMFKRQSDVRGEMTTLVNEMAGNLKLVDAFRYQARAQARFGEINGRLREAGTRALFFSSITNPATRFVNSVVYVAVGVFGAFAAVRGMLTVGQLTSFLNYANQYTKPFNEISGVITELQGALACAARVFELIDAQPEPEDAPDAAALKDVAGRVALDEVRFAYRPDRPLIEGLSLKVEPGQRVAIVGPTGSGKTTLINLLMRFYDVDGGEIRVEGLPIGEIRRDSLRAAYGMVLQDTWLRAGTLRENIAYGRPDASEAQIEAAARSAHADSFIRRLPDGYDTLIHEDGEGISQGQKQLLCIARAMLCTPPMLILDEATSSIDALTELRVQRAFAMMMRGRTSFVVAHRLQTIREADTILVMDGGRVIEQGNHGELIQKNGFYARLYRSQFSA
jgi:ATP-binding cassette subfamily B multidrug efflux pump